MSVTAQNNEPRPKPRREPLSRNAWIIIIAAAMMLGFGIYAAFNWFQIVDAQDTVGAQGEAATNPYLALERLLVASGSAVTRSNKSGEFDQFLAASAHPVMILGDRRLAQMRTERVAQLVAWVKAGGHLIVEAEQPELEDPVLEYWGIDRKRLVWRAGKAVEVDRRKPIDEDADALDEAKPPSTDDVDAASGAPNDADNDVKSSPAPTDTKSADETISPPAISPSKDEQNQSREKLTPEPDVGIEPNRARDGKQKPMTPFNFSKRPIAKKTSVLLADGMNFSARFLPYQNVALKKIPAGVDTSTVRRVAKDREGGRIVEFGSGQGKVTVISNFDFMTWRSLRVDDHAELIWHLVSAGNATKPAVMLAVHPQGDGFWAWMTTHAWMVALSGLALLLIWLWRVIPRMGPLALPQVGARRRLTEHVGAAGRFLAARNQWQSLIQPVRSRILTQMKRRHPRTALMSEAEQIVYLSKLMAVDEGDMMRILLVPVANRHECLYAITQLIQLSRKL